MNEKKEKTNKKMNEKKEETKKDEREEEEVDSLAAAGAGCSLVTVITVMNSMVQHHH